MVVGYMIFVKIISKWFLSSLTLLSLSFREGGQTIKKYLTIVLTHQE